MRLIDADELIEHVWRDRVDSRERIANLVESMPTIKETTPAVNVISRQAAIIEMMDNNIDHAQGTDGREVVQILEDIPAADVVPVVHGTWERIPYSFAGGYRCSCCGQKTMENFWLYCPNCGAKMDGERKENCNEVD